jgi:hypothetical protein
MQRRTFLRNTALAGSAIVMPVFLTGRAAVSEDLIVGHGDYRYKVKANWAKVSPRQYPLINCHEMVADRSGKLYLLGDHSSNNVLVFDRSGKVIDSWGYRYPAGHGLTIFDEGDEETLFICDTGSQSDRQGRRRNPPGSVTKTRLSGEIIFQLGHPQTIGVYQPGESGEVRQKHNGYITILDADNKVVSNAGGTAPMYQDGQLQSMFQDPAVHNLFHHGHDVCVDADENLYLCQWDARGSAPILLEWV